MEQPVSKWCLRLLVLPSEEYGNQDLQAVHHEASLCLWERRITVHTALLPDAYRSEAFGSSVGKTVFRFFVGLAGFSTAAGRLASGGAAMVADIVSLYEYLRDIEKTESPGVLSVGFRFRNFSKNSVGFR